MKTSCELFMHCNVALCVIFTTIGH